MYSLTLVSIAISLELLCAEAEFLGVPDESKKVAGLRAQIRRKLPIKLLFLILAYDVPITIGSYNFINVTKSLCSLHFRYNSNQSRKFASVYNSTNR